VSNENSMSSTTASGLTRRQIVLGTSAMAGTTALAACGNRKKEPVRRPEGVPVGPFGAESTAEEVTSGIDLSGKTVLITGANSGLGLESMRVLALRGAHVIGTARTLEKAREACASVQGKTTPVALELTDFSSVVACASAVQSLGLPLDVLLCNAGIMELPTLEQVNGIEKHFVTNHLGHFLLTNRLLAQVQAAPQGRVVVLASGQAVRGAPAAGIEFDNLSGERNYTPNSGYGQSKLANILFVRELAKRLQGSSTTSNAVMPGVIMTNLGRHMPWWKTTLAKVVGFTFMKSLEAGAATQCYVATAPALATSSGHVFSDCNPVRAGGFTEDDAMAAKLWQVSEDLTRPFLA
jgi:NAD(P)-dependent dehydrogenase (short-subunit alcohol dehydrogenase family)